MFKRSYWKIYILMLLHANCSSLDDRVPGDKIDDYIYHYHDSTDFKMWQGGSLPHKRRTLQLLIISWLILQSTPCISGNWRWYRLLRIWKRHCSPHFSCKFGRLCRPSFNKFRRWFEFDRRFGKKTLWLHTWNACHWRYLTNGWRGRNDYKIKSIVENQQKV